MMDVIDLLFSYAAEQRRINKNRLADNVLRYQFSRTALLISHLCIRLMFTTV